MERMEGIYLLLGTNLGDRNKNLQIALKAIETKIGEIKQYSSLYETDAWGKTNQPAFLNRVVKIETVLPPRQILQQAQAIEKTMGRVRVEKWKERIIDIDILYIDQQIMDSPVLKVPHPEIPNRRFTLVPLNEIAPDFVHPVYKKNQHQLLLACKDPLAVRKVDA